MQIKRVAKCKAAVPLEQEIACLAPTVSARAVSKAAVAGPVVSQSLSNAILVSKNIRAQIAAALSVETWELVWLGAVDDYPDRVVLSVSRYDICIADAPMLRKYQDVLTDCPLLLVVGEGEPDNPFSKFSGVSDIIYAPIRTEELHWRLKKVLSAKVTIPPTPLRKGGNSIKPPLIRGVGGIARIEIDRIQNPAIFLLDDEGFIVLVEYTTYLNQYHTCCETVCGFGLRGLTLANEDGLLLAAGGDQQNSEGVTAACLALTKTG